MTNKIKSSLFDEIFKLQSSAPEIDVDPEDPIDDGAPVNHCVSQELSQMLDRALVELHCSLHPPDGFAAEARQVLKTIDDKCGISSQICGTEGDANLMSAVSKLRYTNLCDRAGFKSFLRLSEANITTIPKYVFHTAGIIVMLKDALCIFLDTYCNNNFFRLAILQDLRQPVIITQLRFLGFKARLAEGVDESEELGATSLRKKAAIISDDPKYEGKKTSRNELYSDEEFQTTESCAEDDDNSDSGEASDNSDLNSDAEVNSIDNDRDDVEEDGDEDEDGEDEDDDEENEVSGEESDTDIEDTGASIVPQTKSDDREKGKAVSFQLGIWDDLIKGRIALQKMVAACNRLPLPDTWPEFNQDSNFRTEANNVHSSVRKLMSALLELQAALTTSQEDISKSKAASNWSDEEITSESETEENGQDKQKPEKDEDEEKMEVDAPKEAKMEKRQKRKLNAEEMEDMISKRHKDFQSFRNDSLSKWDEKTRLASGKIKSKNFAAFELSVLKQIEQVLANRERLVRRLHQQRSLYKILGQQESEGDVKEEDQAEVEDWDDEQDVEMKLKQKSKQELALNTEIIDDSDFYHVCLRDLIEMKQNEETDPVTASKQWLEIQRLRNKQKRKVDTKASKGRKIRYNVKEKLKNFMTPYDKSLWSDEQKEDLFKSLFGGHSGKAGNQVHDVTFDIGI